MAPLWRTAHDRLLAARLGLRLNTSPCSLAQACKIPQSHRARAHVLLRGARIFQHPSNHLRVIDTLPTVQCRVVRVSAALSYPYHPFADFGLIEQQSWQTNLRHCRTVDLQSYVNMPIQYLRHPRQAETDFLVSCLPFSAMPHPCQCTSRVLPRGKVQNLAKSQSSAERTR